MGDFWLIFLMCPIRVFQMRFLLLKKKFSKFGEFLEVLKFLFKSI